MSETGPADPLSDAPSDPPSNRPTYRIVRPFRVRFEESTAGDTIRAAIYLAWTADVAWQHSTLFGFGRDWYQARGLFWLVRAVQLDVFAPSLTYDDRFVSTRVSGWRRIAVRRESEVRSGSGELVARLEFDWVMTNLRGVPTRVPDEFYRFADDSAATFDMRRVALPEAPPDAVERRFHVHRRDLDPMGHVNNSVYLDYFEEALEAAGQGQRLNATPRRYVLEFASSAARDETLVDRAWPLGGGWAYRLTGEDGREILRAQLDLL